MRILLIADLHVGSIKDTRYMYNAVVDIIEQEIIFKKTDAVVILGDYFHRLFKVNEEYVSCAINIMSYLIRACANNGTKIRIVYGTESHEMNQYRLFNYHFASTDVDIKLFDTASEEELFKGVNVLYLPEEYVSSKKKFYKKFLDSGRHYNYIFGHGIIEDGMPAVVSIGEPKSDEKQVARFKSGELAACSDLTVFGHYHKYTDIGNGVYYLGSLFRSSFGEEEAKGYGIIEDGKLIFVENKRAYVYKTYEYPPDSDVYSSTDNIMKELNRIKQENPEVFSGGRQGRIRMMFRIPANLDPSFKENIKDVLVNEKQITLFIKDNSGDTLMQAIVDDLKDEYDYLLDESLPIEEKMHRWILDIDDFDLSAEAIAKYIKRAKK